MTESNQALGGHILVVEDNRVNQLTLSRSLEQQGHRVALAEDGRQALQMLAQQPYDVVLLDILMPQMDGYEVLSHMKNDADLRNIPVIVITALDEVDSAVRCIEMGAEDYLPKPFNPVFLKARLEASLRRKKLRDLEQAYLQQEVALRQNEKLATLGKLGAGMAHELNNPAAAAKRGVEQVQSAFQQLLKAQLDLDQSGLSAAQVTTLQELAQTLESRREQITTPLTRSDREATLEQWLDGQGVGNTWEIAPPLVTMGYTPDELAQLATPFTPRQLPALLTWLVSSLTILNVLAKIGAGTMRISEIVGALKTYSYMDQAPLQSVDVHEGLENTLVILHSKLQQIAIHRDYVPDLPAIEAYGSELNQVWTNIIDNAIYAMKGQGELTLRTYQDDNFVVVEISDTGSGIPKEIQGQIFDPFFTTKPPGEGVGLGLNTSHSVVQKHKGEIAFSSQPGKTCFQVKLPLSLHEKR